jgi:hypothetical protein
MRGLALVLAAWALPASAQLTRSSFNLRAQQDILGAIDVRAFGAVCDGTTDDSAAFTAAISVAMQSGREMRLPAGTCMTAGQIALPNDGLTPPKQKPLRIVGAGATMNGRGATAGNGGTVWDATFAGTTYGKILTTGLGLLEVTGVTFTDSGGGTLPWIYTTNTTLKIHDNAFIGNRAGVSADQDCIILGGTVAVEGQGDPTHGFQGYGTVIRDNHFHRIRRAVYGRVFANATVIRDNTVWSNCGSNLAGGAAIEFDDVSGAQNCTGNVIAANLIEITNYPYAVKLGKATQNTIIGNNIFDATGVSSAAVRFEANATQNVLFDGYVPGSLAKIDDKNGTNQHFAIDQGVASYLGTGGEFVIYSNDFHAQGAANVPFAGFKNTTNSDRVWIRMGGAAGAPSMLFVDQPSGSAAENLALLSRLGANQAELLIYGSTFAGVKAPDGDLTLRYATGKGVKIGSASGAGVYSGAGDPENVVTAPVGSLWLRTDGGAGSALYVKQSGAGFTGWAAK